MNIIKGKIDIIESYDSLSLVRMKAGDFHFTTIVIETPETADYLTPGGKINILFKETEVLICRKPCPQISLQNRIEGSIKEIRRGKLLSQITLSTGIGEVRSIITSHAVRQLDLKEQDIVIAMIKTNEIMLQHD